MINEITTGMGRTGKWFGFQHYGIQPDIVAMGKGLGNGYPVSATAFTKNVSDKVKVKDFKYAQSHQNDILGAVIAKEVIHIIRDENLINISRQTGEYFIAELKKLSQKHNTIKEIRGRGLMIAIDINDDKENTKTTYIHEELLKKGYIITHRPNINVFRIDPALTIPVPEINNFLTVFTKLLH